MKIKSILPLALSIFLSAQPLFASSNECAQLFRETELATARVETSAKLDFKTSITLSDFTGQTFLSLAQEKIKPSLDEYAKNGFKVADKATVVAALDKVSDKVKAQAMKAAGSIESLEKVVDSLQDQDVTLYNLPEKIAAADSKVDRYGLSTFLALASGGGVMLEIAPDILTYNVNYGTGAEAKDEMTGRTFVKGPGHLADDISDKTYLTSLQTFIKSADEAQIRLFYENLLNILIKSDTSKVSLLSPEGQTALAENLGIYTAEQVRHLMGDLESHAWDVSLLEVTILAAFHSGQDKTMVMFGGKLLDRVPKQAPGGEPRTIMKDADLTDFWQFSSSSDPKSKNRSGINETKSDWRGEGMLISNDLRSTRSDVVQNIERHFVGQAPGGNVIQKFSNLLISKTAPRTIKDADALISDMLDFIMASRAEANAITQQQVKLQGSN